MSRTQESALSKRYHDLFSLGALTRSDTETVLFFTAAGTLDWTVLGFLLPEGLIQDADGFTSAVDVLAPAFYQCECVLSSMTKAELLSKLSSFIQWTGKEKVLEECLDLLKGDNPVCTHLALLLLSSTLERALGDLYLTKGSNCPSLLKDLLTTPELTDILGKTVIQVLRVMIGPPTSLNIRNIVWHGFPVPGEIPKRFVWFLFWLYPSIGEVLCSKSLAEIKHRRAVEFPQTSLLGSASPVFPPCELSQVQTTLDSLCGDQKGNEGSNGGGFVLPAMAPVWSRALKYFSEERYGHCLVLVVPQLEHALRLVFADVNKCPERVCTAESTTLYTTFDEMLDPFLPSGDKNKLIETLGEKCLDLLHDLLVYPEGPRVRDRLSHGEVDLDSLPEPLARSVLWAILCCWHRCPSQTPVQLPFEWIDNYESLFHPIASAKRSIAEVFAATSHFESVLKFTPKLQNWCPEDGTDTFTSGNVKYSNILQQACVLSQHLMPCLNCEENLDRFLIPFHVDDCHISDLLKRRIPTLFRGQTLQTEGGGGMEGVREGELVALCQRVAAECKTVASQVASTLQDRQAQFQQRSLRSRQRDNFCRLLEGLPSLFVGINLTMIYLSWVLYNLDSLSQKDLQTKKTTLKLMKSALQTAENLRTYTSPDKNKWVESVGLVETLVRKLADYIQDGPSFVQEFIQLR